MSYNDIVQAIADASKDADTLEQVINGEAETQVKSRLGRMVYTLSTISSRINNLTIQANQKLTELQDAINTAAAAGAGANGWTDILIETSENVNQRQINDGLESIAQLLAIENPRNGMRVYVKSYYVGLGKGGGTFIYDTTKSTVNDEGIVINGWVRDDTANLTPDMFGAKPNDPNFDNTDALNRAFSTGKTIYGNQTDTYFVNGILNTKGQSLLGGWKISTSRYNLGVVSTEVEPANNTVIKMLYLESAYDLSELLYIKSLGFNTINHYGYFANNGTIDASGTFAKLLDNAKSAGLQVNVGTESDEARNDLTLFIGKYDSHPSVWGYSVYDEPATRGIAIADQDAKITQLRGLTQKYLTMVDLLVSKSAFKQLFSTNYDIVFVDSYATRNGKATLQERIKKDLENMRMDFGGIKAMTKQQRIYPVVSAMLNSGSYYTDDLAQIIATSEIYGKVGGGNFGMFAWDAVGDTEITGRLRDNVDFKELAKRLTSQDVRTPLATDAYIFGFNSQDTDWGIQDLLDNLVKPDPFTTDPHVGSNAYPIMLKPTGTDTDRTSTLSKMYSGIGMKGVYSALPTTIKARKHIRAKLQYIHTTADPAATFELFETWDNGYSIFLTFADAVTSGKIIDFSSAPQNPNNTLIFRLLSQGDTATTKYRKFLCGLVVTTDW